MKFSFAAVAFAFAAMLAIASAPNLSHAGCDLSDPACKTD